MRVLVCPDKFAGTLSAPAAASALAQGWLAGAPADVVVTLPLSDGGPGFVEVLGAALGRPLRNVATCDPLGRPVAGQILRVGSTAYLESAHACGLHLLSAAQRDPRTTTSYGLGVLIAAAVETGAGEIVVGLGGSATNDAGAGMLAALGAAAVDSAGLVLPYGGAALAWCAGLAGQPRLRGASLVAATDVDNPLTGPGGASAVYGPQKGASPADVALLDAALARFASVLERDLPSCPPGLATAPGGGAAGGLGAAILACGGRREPGLNLVARLVGLWAALDSCDLVLTGEGSFDAQSLSGKVVGALASAARDRGVPCAVVAGRVGVDPTAARRLGVSQTRSLVVHFGDESKARARASEGLRSIAARLAGQRSAGRP